jgi:hypothetical protein
VDGLQVHEKIARTANFRALCLHVATSQLSLSGLVAVDKDRTNPDACGFASTSSPVIAEGLALLIHALNWEESAIEDRHIGRATKLVFQVATH